MSTVPLVVSFGAGVNSAAMLIGMHERGIKPDLILFADTGAEKPETYVAVAEWSAWAESVGFPRIERVQNDGIYGTLEINCLAKNMLPSLAYGFKSCSDKYKIRPQDKFVARWPVAIACWGGGGRVRKAIGFDAGEAHRIGDFNTEKYEFWTPLVEWQWRRRDCIESITRLGMPVPIKSACYFCPASKKSEVLWLKREHPELYEAACVMERLAAPNLGTVRGLGRHWSWEELGRADEAQFKMFPETVETPCVCFDGEGESE